MTVFNWKIMCQQLFFNRENIFKANFVTGKSSSKAIFQGFYVVFAPLSLFL